MSGDDEGRAVAYIGLGSNLGDREACLGAAREALSRTRGVALVGASSVARTTPVDNTNQPEFLNQVVSVETRMPARSLLACLQAIEDGLGRVRTTWKGPRTIDLDILLYGGRIIRERDLTVPHPALLRRTFLVRQILEIDPETVEPETRRRLSSFLPRV